MSAHQASVAVIGGSGFYSLLDDVREVQVKTPYGDPSDALFLCSVGDRTVAFLPRHGRDHQYPPHRINYLANMWALHSVGVRQVIAPCAVGSLRPELGPGTLVIPDQLIDRTSGRQQSYYDSGAAHVPFSDPYCPHGRAAVMAAAQRSGTAVTDGSTMVVVEGPRFSTRAESQWYASQGWSLVNMTGLPEAVLARELAMCYTAVALVTDLDAGLDDASAVSQDQVFTVFARNTELLRSIVLDVLAALPTDRTCLCPHSLDGIEVALGVTTA